MKTSVGVSQEMNFIVSSYCNGGTCIAVAAASNGEVLVKDTKREDKSTLHFTKDEWDAFVKGVKNGEFDIR